MKSWLCLLFVALFLVCCAASQPQDSQPLGASGEAAANPEARPAPEPGINAPPQIQLSPEVCAACAEVYHLVQAVPGTIVTRYESTLRTDFLQRDLTGCLVLAAGAWSELAGRSCPGDSICQHLSKRGWKQEPRYSADGHDGTFFTFSKDGIWCFVRGFWDGGDDVDTTYVPRDAYQFVILCAEFDGKGRNDPEDE